MQQLTNLDASFLHLESDHTPMHVGGVLIFDAPKNGPMTFERLRAHVEGRLSSARVFRQRLFVPPYHLDAPWWVEDAEFHLDRHLRRVEVAAPLTHHGLEGPSAEFFREPLRRDRPLWELLYVEAEDPAAGFAVLLKIHHAALDGVSAEAVLSGLLDLDERAAVRGADTWAPEPPPDLASVLRRRADSREPFDARAGELLRTAARLGRRFLERATGPTERELPYYFSAPQTPFNVPISGRRIYVSAELSLRTIERIKSARAGVTVNDVVLAIGAEAMRRYLEDDGELPSASLVAMAPISKRTLDQRNALGNKVSAMLIGLATDVADPLERLATIHENARRAKAYSREMTIEALFDQLPSSGPAIFLDAFARLGVARHLPPLFNVTVTNVPGSPVPLYLDGAMLKSMTGMAGVYDGLGLTLVVTSYRDTLSIGVTSTPEALTEPHRFVRYLEQAADALELAVARAVDTCAATTMPTTA